MLLSEFLNTIPVRNSVFGVKVWVFCWRAQFQDRKNQRREEVGLHDNDDSSLELYKHDADDAPFNFLFIYPTPFFVLLPSKMMGSTLQNPLASANTSPFETKGATNGAPLRPWPWPIVGLPLLGHRTPKRRRQKRQGGVKNRLSNVDLFEIERKNMTWES